MLDKNLIIDYIVLQEVEMGTSIKLSSARMRYGFSLKELATMYGLTYYRVWKMHTQGWLAEYLKDHQPVKK